MKVLALYGSRHGQAESVLRRVARTLEAGRHSVDVVDCAHMPLALRVEDYGGVVIGACVHLGRYPPYIRRFVRAQRAKLAERPTAFVSVNGTRPESSPEWKVEADAYTKRFLLDSSWAPTWTATFSGALRYSRYGIFTRLIMARIAGREGSPTDTSRDYEFTDWAAVDRFARRVALGMSEAAVETAS